MANNLLECVEWNIQDIEETALRIVSLYTRELSPVYGTQMWLQFTLERLLPAIRQRGTLPVYLEGVWFELVFQWPKPLPTFMDGQIIWQEKGPNFVFIDRTREELTPSLRNTLYKANSGIAEEAQSVYKLNAKKYPFSMIFPPEYYAKSVSMQRAFLID